VIDADRLRPLAELVPVLESPTADFGRWEVPPPRDGVRSLGWFEFGPAGEAFLAAVAKGGWVTAGFDWRTWLDGDEAADLQRRPDALESATVEQLARLLTAIVRSDRFVEGSIAGAFESGLLTRIARRADALLTSR